MTLGSQDIQALKDRGVTNPDEFASLNAAVLNDELRRFDSDSAVGAGALVHRLRHAARTKRPVSLTQREAEYANEVVAWLEANFPELCQPVWGPHPAAVAAVIRLHHIHGKRGLSKGAHGPVVRAAVAEWERGCGDESVAA